MIKNIILVGLGGGIGSIFRYLASLCVNKYHTSSFPLATFLVNITGCLVIGLLIGLSVRHNVFDKEMKALLITGFCGGYTTFSTFSSENLTLLQSNNYLTLISYVLASVIIGILAVWAGYELSKI